MVLVVSEITIPETVLYSHWSNWKWNNSKLFEKSEILHCNFTLNMCFADKHDSYTGL